MSRSRAALALLCLCISLVPATPDARVGSRIVPGLSDADLHLMRVAAARLYQQNTVANGATDSWSNPKSGNRGSVTILQSFTKSAMPCREVRYDVHLQNRRGMRSYTLNWCRTAAGAWKIM
jgi:surface antigen